MIASQLPHWLIVGFTGHRKIQNDAFLTDQINLALDKITDQFTHVSGISSAASGADTLFLGALQKRDIPYQVVLPFPRSEFKKDFTKQEWSLSEPLINHAFYESVLPVTCERDEAFLESGILTADKCDILIAIWNGEAAAGKGGTAEIVAYARAHKHPLIIIDSNTGTITEEHLDLLAGKKAAQDTVAPPVENLEQLVAQAYGHFDQNATSHGPWARRIVVLIILLHLLASAIAIAGEMLDIFKGQAWTSWFKVIALLSALYLVYLHHKFQHKWVDTRPAAEICRMFLAIWPLKRQGESLQQAILKKHHGLARDVMMAWQMDKQATLPFEEAKKSYLINRVENQLNYYRNELTPAKKYHKRLRQFANAFTLLAIFAGTVALVNKYTYFLDANLYGGLKFLSILLPLATTAILSSVLVIDYGRRVKRYVEMISMLESAENKIRHSPGWPSLWRAVNELEQTLLNEVEEWQSLTIFTGESH